jgi:hypothetical protein
MNEAAINSNASRRVLFIAISNDSPWYFVYWAGSKLCLQFIHFSQVKIERNADVSLGGN